MRQYQNFAEALNEIKRELKEMGVQVKTKSVQNKIIENDPQFFTQELEDYVYMVTQPHYGQIPKEGLDESWCEAEFIERVCGRPLNPGEAWKLREPYWKQFLVDGKFDYSYPERMTGPLDRVIDELLRDPMSRRAYLSVWDRQIDKPASVARVPCSLGYHFKFRQGKLNMTYFLRSSDYFEHLPNDLYLANRLQHYVAHVCQMEPGHFVHHVGSLHCFAKDVKDVF